MLVSSFMAQGTYKKALSLEQSETIYLNQDEWRKALSMLGDEPSEKMNTLLPRAIVLSVVKFDKSFDRDGFDCGVVVPNDFLQGKAG